MALTESEIAGLKKKYRIPGKNFTARAKLLQCLWAEKQGYEPERQKHSHHLAKPIADAWGNFFPEVGRIAREALENKEDGACYNVPRYMANMLSSQPLCPNLFGVMREDSELATQYFSRLFPDRVKTVQSLCFEHAPKRGKKATEYLEDHTAFDVFVEYEGTSEKKGFIGIEVKYTENMDDANWKKNYESHGEVYRRVARKSGVFADPDDEKLWHNPVAQIWRDHLLAHALLQHGYYAEGFYIFLHPRDNTDCADAVAQYLKLLNADEAATGFYPRHLDDFAFTLLLTTAPSWAREFHERYLGFL